MTSRSREALVDLQSRELVLVCDPAGAILWADERARRLVGLREGRSLLDAAVPGTGHKASTLLERARAAQVRGWEAPLLVDGRPVTVSFCGCADEEGNLVLVGSVIPDEYGQALHGFGEALNEIVALHREVARQKGELEERHRLLEQAHRELDDSARGVMALHAELDDRGATLRQHAEVRDRIVANVSHEFRTPLHSILGISRLLLDHSDGPLLPEQEVQVRFVRQAAEELAGMVDDLLDVSKLEAGKMGLRVEAFPADELLGALRGMLRPLVPAGSPVELHVEPGPEGLRLETDRSKVSQILRNLVSNALKFTEAGEVRVRCEARGGRVVFTVRDTGVGIAPEDQERVFEEFGQVDHPLQGKVRGTGLGLSLSRRLAGLLGGSLTVESAVGAGATFRLELPATHPEVAEMAELTERSRHRDPSRPPVLVVEDDRKTMFVYERYLSLSGFQAVPARTVDEARALLGELRPIAVILDIMLEQESTWSFLHELKADPATREVPVLVVTITNREQKARALGADDFWLKPLDQDRLVRKLRGYTTLGSGPATVLVIDDDERARYIARKMLVNTPYTLVEAATGREGIELAQSRQPDVILLDFLLREMTAFDVLDELKADPRTRGIPVIIATAHSLPAAERERLAAHSEAILAKEKLSRELALSRIRDALGKVHGRGGR